MLLYPSDGWGEDLEQRKIKTDGFGNIYAHFWSFSDDWSLKTEAELDAQEETPSLEIGAITL